MVLTSSLITVLLLWEGGSFQHRVWMNRRHDENELFSSERNAFHISRLEMVLCQRVRLHNLTKELSEYFERNAVAFTYRNRAPYFGSTPLRRVTGGGRLNVIMLLDTWLVLASRATLRSSLRHAY